MYLLSSASSLTPQLSSLSLSVCLSLYSTDHRWRRVCQVSCSAFDKHTQYKDVAQAIKKDYDKRYPSSGKATDGVYHAVVGKHFGGE